MSNAAFGQSIFSNMERNRIMAETDRDANSRIALDAIGGSDPIISLNTEYNLQRVADYYRRLVTAGGWPLVPENVYGLTLGNRTAAVNDLRRYLVHTGDLAQDSEFSEFFDAPLDAAVRGFQARHGLQITGEIEEYTYNAMRVPATTRLNQLELNLQRVRNLEGLLGNDRYVVVNIPAALIEAIESEQVTQRHTAVVGRVDRQTPILSSRVHQINFNPYWTVPKSIIARDITEYMRENPNYLAESNIHIFDGNGNEIDPMQIDWNSTEATNYTLRQDPGTQNAMGNVKINFHNPHAVYLHDTPQQSLFAGNARFHSSGCVRVERVDELVAWILRQNGYDIVDVNATFASGERLDVSVDQPPRILTTYVTAWANRNGVVSFRDDIYEFDAAGRTEFPELSA